MRLRSTEESVAKGEPSLLAIAETLLAISVSLFIAIQYQTIIHIVGGAVLAAFLFLRTKDSTLQTLKWFEERGYDRSKVEWSNILFTVAMPLQCGLIKSYYTLYHLLVAPTNAIRAISKNWASVSLTTDIFHAPELIPGAEAYREQCGVDFYWNDFLETLLAWSEDEVAKEPSPFWKYVIRFSNDVSMLVDVLLFFGISYLFRFFLKSTSLLYFPLLMFPGVWKLRGQTMSTDTGRT